MPSLAALIQDFRIFFEHSLTARLSNPPPNPFEETPMLAERVQRWIDTYRAEGEARGKAKGRISSIHELVLSGDLTRERAITRLRHLVDQRIISPAQAEAAIQHLPT